MRGQSFNEGAPIDRRRALGVLIGAALLGWGLVLGAFYLINAGAALFTAP